MALIVQKFGGTSVGTPERIRSVADRIARTRSLGNQVVVVVSAMGHTTDELLGLACQITDNPPHREMDMLLSTGERISMALLSMALHQQACPAISLTGSQTGIITDGSHRRARIRRILGDRVKDALQRGAIAIVAGFQGVSESKEITTLGRGGSDTTAVALAASLGADFCEIYTDVDGVYSADPRVVPRARLWKTMRADLMVEMATRGAGVLHPRSVELAKQFRVPLMVRNSLNNNEGTFVISNDMGSEVEKRSKLRDQGMEEFTVAGVTSDQDKIFVLVRLSRPSVLRALWDKAAELHLSMIAPIFSEGEVRFFSDRDGAQEWKKGLEGLSFDGFVKDFWIDPSIIPVSIIGDRFSQDGRAFAEIMEVLMKAEVPVHFGTSSSLAMTVGVPLTHAEDAVKALHAKYLEG